MAGCATSSPQGNAQPYRKAASANEAWLKQFEPRFIASVCQEDKYFRACFNVSEAKCGRTMRKALHKFFKEQASKMPNNAFVSGRGLYWGEALMSCTGRGYEVAMEHRRISNPHCNDTLQWMAR